jgi:predicted DNA-binding transcriptional regulator AlpA
MPESFEMLQAVERGYLRVGDVVDVLGVSRQRCDQLTQRDGFPQPKAVGGRRLWRRSPVEVWYGRLGGERLGRGVALFG